MTPYGTQEALESLRESRKKTESALTPKARIYRRLKGGRPKKLGFDKPTPLHVVNTLFNEIERGHQVMDDEGANNRDLRWEVLYFTEGDGKPQVTGWSTSGLPKTTTEEAIKILKHFAEIREDFVILRIKWWLDTSRLIAEGEDENEIQPDDLLPFWETKFNAYPLNSAAIAAALEEEAKTK